MARAVLALLLWVQLQLGALRVLGRLPGWVGTVAVVVVWAASLAAAWALAGGRLRPPRRLLGRPWAPAALVAAVALCTLVVYPAVDGRRATGGGSDADDAAVLVAGRLRSGEDPFAADTYLGNPPTTGPASALWAVPFPGRRSYAAGTAVALAATLLLLRRWSRGWAVPAATALVLAGSVPFWEGVAQGSDHLPMACGLAVAVVAAERLQRQGGTPGTPGWRAAGLAAAAGVLATWRAAYLHLPVLLALALWRRSPRAAVLVGVGGTVLAVALHLALLARTDGWGAYDPVQQLLVKSDEDLSATGRLAVAAGTAAAGAVVLAEARRPLPRPAVLVLAGIGGPMAAIAVVGAVTASDPAAWSEASYLQPTLVLASLVAGRWLLQSRPS